jgi:methionyl-tRNA synthetase
MTHNPRKILVTSALPYANGPIHIGHLVEYIQTDIWVRFQKMRHPAGAGHQIYYVCADDAHGTPIMLRARQDNITPETLITRVKQEHERDFAEFAVGFDNYHTTHSDENRELATLIYERLAAGGHIAKRTIRQAYDPVREMFLPDRFIRGECPKCGARDQYGDSCEVCGATYSPTDLKNPVSAISGATPVEKESEHYFFRLGDFETMLRDWTKAGHLQNEVSNKLDEWFRAGLQEWDISRDKPYFGFQIPGTEDKYFYVWLDAPIGYLASFRNLCEREGINFDDFIGRDSAAEMYHFIGKDIIYFHALFWPAMLHGSRLRTPTAIFAHGFLTVNGQKMSKSRGTFITARTYLDHLDPQYLRYYFAAKLGSGVDDIDLNFEDFTFRVNSDLVGKVVNIASRCAGFITKRLDGKLAGTLHKPDLLDEFKLAGTNIASAYEQREYSRAMREIMLLADKANQYIDEFKPWVIAKEQGADEQLRSVCTTGLNFFRHLMIYLKPVLPVMAQQAEQFLNIDPLLWKDIETPLLNHTINEYRPLMTRVEKERIDRMIEASKEDLKSSNQTPAAATEGDGLITIDDFMKVDLRVARIVRAAHVDGADKLLQLTLDIGGETRNVFAGIKSAYQPEQLEGRLTVMVANLAPRKMKFGVSEGMVLAASGEGPGIYILSPDMGAEPGMRIK